MPLRIEEITKHMLELFEKHRIEDTPKARINYLHGYKEAIEMATAVGGFDRMEASFIQFACSGEIFHLEMKTMFDRL